MSYAESTALPLSSRVREDSAGEALKLDALPLGARAVVGSPDSVTPTVLRLMEMGLTAGAEVTLTRRAPFGDPLEVELRGTRLCLRRADAARFSVRTIGEAA